MTGRASWKFVPCQVIPFGLVFGNFSYCRRSLKGALARTQVSSSVRHNTRLSLASLLGRAHKPKCCTVANCGLWLVRRNMQQRQEPYATRTTQLNYKKPICFYCCVLVANKSSQWLLETSSSCQTKQGPKVGHMSANGSSRSLSFSIEWPSGWPEDMFPKTEIRWQAQTVSETRAASQISAALRQKLLHSG